MATTEERLLAKTIRDGECLLFVGSRGRNGYGRLWDGAVVDGAHRVAYRLWVGPIPEGFAVCHTCDTPNCVEPSHLFAADQLENMRDMASKGRRSEGDEHSARIRAGWTPEVRRAYGERWRIRNEQRRAERRRQAGVPDDWWPCADCDSWYPDTNFKKRPDGSPKSYCRPCDNRREKERQRRKRLRGI